MFKRNKLSQFKKSLRTVVLDDAQKTACRETIVAFMKTHPVRISEGARLKNQNRGNIFTFLTQKHMYATLAIILTLLAGSGTAFAAENTLPGDTLYGVKIHVNEPVREALAISENAKNEWATVVTERRLDEATKLSVEGKLTAEAENALKIRIVEQTDKIQKHIASLKASGEVETASNMSAQLESILNIHQEILNALDEDENKDESKDTEKNEKPPNEIRPLLKELHNEKEQIKSIQKEMNEEVRENKKENSKEAAENRMHASQNHIDEVQKFFVSKNVTATSSAMIKLEEARKVQAKGKVELDTGNFGAAFELFGKAQRIAQEAKITVQLRNELKKDDHVKKILDRVEERKDKITDDLKQLREDKKETLEKINEELDKKIEDVREMKKDFFEQSKEKREELKQREEKLNEEIKAEIKAKIELQNDIKIIKD